MEKELQILSETANVVVGGCRFITAELELEERIIRAGFQMQVGFPHLVLHIRILL